jgi:hypothetical protein
MTDWKDVNPNCLVWSVINNLAQQIPKMMRANFYNKPNVELPVKQTANKLPELWLPRAYWCCVFIGHSIYLYQGQMEQTKRNVILGSIFAVLALALIIIPILVFRRPNSNNQARWGQVHIHLSENFSQHHKEQASLAARELSRLGPTFVIGGEGPNSVEVISVDLTDGRPANCSRRGVARYDLTPRGESKIFIDPTCTQGNLEFRTAFMHEIGHALGMQHICLPSEERNDCSPVGRGFAVMNPNIVQESTEPEHSIDSSDPGPVPTFEIQELDLREFERVARPGQPLIRPLSPRGDSGVD